MMTEGCQTLNNKHTMENTGVLLYSCTLKTCIMLLTNVNKIN